VRFGGTVVLCTATVEDGVPAEYAMLPRATTERTRRERHGPGGRSSEIQRLIGRSLRAGMQTFRFGERTITVDCDVLQADGGTRTAAITGGAVAVADACAWLEQAAGIESPFGSLVAAVSVGIVDGEVRLDLSYVEDKNAQVDANIVMIEPNRFVEVQSTSEGVPFDRHSLHEMLDLAQEGAEQLFAEQREVLAR
jgi:ribonuclease PH